MNVKFSVTEDSLSLVNIFANFQNSLVGRNSGLSLELKASSSIYLGKTQNLYSPIGATRKADLSKSCQKPLSKVCQHFTALKL